VDTFTVARTEPAETFQLRQRVLRPHQRPEEMALPGDDDPDTAHFGARREDGRLVGTASIRRETPSWAPGRADAWRLRGMATEPQLRSRGIGAAVLAAVFDHLAARGGGLLWCHARLAAVEFYRRGGLVTRGEPWDEPEIGPHVVMWRELEGC
jgi:GNAT superfamily N-acetyltransferase